MTREGSQASKEAIAETQKRISELSKVIEDQTRVAGILKKTVGDLTQLLPFELFSKKFCLNISELGLEIV